jgi:hypothetical protein
MLAAVSERVPGRGLGRDDSIWPRSEWVPPDEVPGPSSPAEVPEPSPEQEPPTPSETPAEPETTPRPLPPEVIRPNVWQSQVLTRATIRSGSL